MPGRSCRRRATARGSFRSTTARRETVKGYLRSIVLEDPSGTVPGWVMVIAKTYPAAIRATELVQVTWRSGETAAVSDQDLRDHAAALIADKPAGATSTRAATTRGRRFARATTRSLRRPTRPPACSISSSSPSMPWPSKRTVCSRSTPATRRRASSCRSSPRPWRFRQRKSSCGPTSSAAGFGRRLQWRLCRAGSLGGQGAGRAGQDGADPRGRFLPRFHSIADRAELRMAFDAGAHAGAMDHAACAGWPTGGYGPRRFMSRDKAHHYDPFSIAGADHWYEVGHPASSRDQQRSGPEELSGRAGSVRSAPGWTNWALESFIDEAAHHARHRIPSPCG